jgi:hypothetical protein
MQSRKLPLPAPARRAAIVALLLALVLAQTLGWMHRVLHGSGLEGGQHAFSAAVEPAQDEGAHDHGVHDLFGSHEEPTDCRLFDVLGQPGCATPPLLVLPVLVPAAQLAHTQADFVARWAALFDARGPPHPR